MSAEIFEGNVIVGRSTRSIAASLQELRKTTLLASIVTLLIGTIGAYWLAHSVERPILALCDAAQKVGAGDLTQRVSIAFSSELTQLGTAFNKMVIDLETYMGAVAASRAKASFSPP